MKVWNKGTMPHQNGVGKIEAYWAQASMGLGWKAPFDGSTSCNNLKLGGLIGSQTLRPVNEDFVDFTHNDEIEKDFTIYEFEWLVPDPDKYKSCFPNSTTDNKHFCILARMEDGNPMNETTNLFNNIKNNNNIALKNITIMGDGLTITTTTHDCVVFGNYGDDVMHDVNIRLQFPTDGDRELLDYADIQINFEDGIIQEWQMNGERGHGAIWQGGGNVLLNEPDANIRGIELYPNEVRELCIYITPRENTDRKFEFDIIQSDGNNIINGERYQINGMARTAEGRSLKNYKSKSKLANNKNFFIYPNPVDADFVNLYWTDKNSSKTIKLIDCFGRELSSFKSNLGSFQLPIADYPSGTYFVQLIDDKTSSIDSQRLMIQKE
jgi:hypothetical protein